MTEPATSAGPDLFAAAASAAGALAVRIRFDADGLALDGEAAALGLSACARAGAWSGFLDRVADADRAAARRAARPGRIDQRLRIAGEDGEVRYARLIGLGDGTEWTGLLIPAGGGADGGAARIAREAALADGVRDGEVIAHYQPIVRLADGRLDSFEALARWLRPGEGLLGPDDFIPLAGALGLLGEIGDQVRGAATADLAAWRAAGARIDIAANATASEIAAPGFSARLLERLAACDLPASSFKLEISETEVMRDPDAAGGVLQGLADAGVRLALDDFGTGYSSLARLDRLPFDTVKIDQYFVRAMTADPSARTIVQSVVSLARGLGMSVTAEGVETVAAADMLKDMGCDCAQGFLYAGALSPVEAAALAARGRI